MEERTGLICALLLKCLTNFHQISWQKSHRYKAFTSLQSTCTRVGPQGTNPRGVIWALSALLHTELLILAPLLFLSLQGECEGARAGPQSLSMAGRRKLQGCLSFASCVGSVGALPDCESGWVPSLSPLDVPQQSRAEQRPGDTWPGICPPHPALASRAL